MTVTLAQINTLASAPTKAGIDALIVDNPGSTGTMIGSVRCRSCNDCQFCKELDTCVSCTRCNYASNSKRLTDCTYISHAYDCMRCRGSTDATSSYLYQCEDCVGCDHCIGLKGATNMSYNFCGVDLSAATATFDAIFAALEASA